jgi:Amt family ammonium transporter
MYFAVTELGNGRNAIEFLLQTVNPAVTDQGLIFGETTLFINQSVALILVSVFAFTLLFVFIVNKITPLRVTEDKEELGLDISQHGEFL